MKWKSYYQTQYIKKRVEKMAAITINDLLTKISNIFKTDMYILDWRYCLGGKVSESKNPGTILCVLEPDVVKVLKNEFPKNKVIFFSDIKKAKTDQEEFIKTDFTESEENELFKKQMDLDNDLLRIREWKSLGLTEKQVYDLLKRKTIVGIRASNRYEFVITNQLLPLVTESTVGTVTYTITKTPPNDSGICMTKLILKYDHPYFVYYNTIYYLTA